MNKPNNDIASESSLAGQLMGAFRHLMMNTDDMLPATVVSYDDATNRAVLKPLVMMVSTEGQRIARALVHNIPVFRFGGGGFFIRVPLKAGDFGWLKANDRDISLIFQRGGLEDVPNTHRLKSFSDAMFFPDSIKGWIVDGKNIDALVVQSLNGNVCLALHNGQVVLDTPVFEVNATESIFNGNLTVNGNHQTNGGIMQHNGKNIGADHQHGGVQPGSGDSGVPV
jgi:hypothetical protein